MNYELLNIVVGIICFLLFVVVQSVTINGIKGTFEEGMIFEKYGKWVKSLGWIGKPLGSCIKCMGASFGGLLFWPTVIWLFDFQMWQVPVFVADVFCVSILSWYFYKKL